MGLLSFLSLLILANTGCKGLKIETQDEFATFLERVNKGNTFNGATVLLMNDLDFDRPLNFTHTDTSLAVFKGTFDGQGHAIRNLKISSSSGMAGLFGTCIDAELKNIYLDSSCTITYDLSNGIKSMSVGGVVGFMSADEKSSLVENTVCMTRFMFTGSAPDGALYVGGITGYSLGTSEKVVIKNTAFLGTINLSGDLHKLYVGGITGGINGDALESLIINCNFAGNILLDEFSLSYNTSETIGIVGGLAGYAQKGSISNCVSNGRIDLETGTEDFVVGSVVGSVLNSMLDHCYRNKNNAYPAIQLNVNSTAEYMRAFNNDYRLYDEADPGKRLSGSLIDELNDYVEKYNLYGYQRWILNKDGHVINATIKRDGGNILRVLKTKLILLPGLTDRSTFHFDGWYMNEKKPEVFEGGEVNKDMEIFGTWKELKKRFTVYFDTMEVQPITGWFGEVVQLPRNIILDETQSLGCWRDKYQNYVSWDFTIPDRDVKLTAVWINTKLSSPEDLENFTKYVNMGVDCKGITISLTNDITMKNSIEPIGRVGKPFLGVFDGKGHTIHNLRISSSYPNVGLIGYSNGMTIRNLVLDSGSTIVSTFRSMIEIEHEICVGAFVGKCYASTGNCTAENLIWLGKITTSNLTNDKDLIRLGGIVGNFRAQQYSADVVNCASYGTEVYRSSGLEIHTGGIIGLCFGMLHSSSTCKVTNCLENGVIVTTDGTMDKFLDVGGIAGCMDANAVIQNSVWTGEVRHQGNETGKLFLGTIVGFMKNSLLDLCYWDNYHSEPIRGGHKKGEVTNSFKYDEDVNVEELSHVGPYLGYSLINLLIAFSLEGEDLSRWTLNFNNMTVKFIVIEGNGGIKREILTTNTRIVLLPELGRTEDRHFSGWYSDPEFTTPFLQEIIYENMTLYGRWDDTKDRYIATFHVPGKKTYTNLVPSGRNMYSYLKNYPKRGGHEFVHWKDTYGKVAGRDYEMPDHDITLTAVYVKTGISTARELREFSEAVSAGASCTGLTITLNNDIDLAGEPPLVPIGSNMNSFNGVFEGQGYRIINMEIATDSTTQYTGLFGVSFTGTEIRNLVLDSSCAITSSHDYTYTYIGGVLGYCLSRDRDCKVTNVINFADILADGMSGANDLTLGGIVGQCRDADYGCVINNCANYGNLKTVGKHRKTYMGGIIAVCTGKQNSCIVANSLNYGSLTHSGNTTDKSWLDMGGIIGMSENYNNIAGCVSMGAITTNQTSTCVRSISGNTNVNMNYDGSLSSEEASGVQDNFWSEDLFYGDYTGANPEINGTFALSDETLLLNRLLNTTAGSTVELVNWKDKRCIYKSVWLLNEGMHNVTFRLNGRKKSVVVYSSRVILAPTLVQSRDHYFNGWYHNSKCTLGVDLFEVTKDMTLYAEWKDGEYLRMMVVVTAAILAGIILLVVGTVVGFYLRGYKKANHRNKDLKYMLYPKVYDAEEPENTLNKYAWLYPSNYMRPEMEDALITAGIDRETAFKITDVCYNNAYKLADQGKLAKGVTEDDAAAIAMYTYELGYYKYKMNPYRLINDALEKNDETELRKIKDILYLVMTALRKLPVVHGIDLHRGIRDDVSDKLKAEGFRRPGAVLNRITSASKTKPKFIENALPNGSSKVVWSTLSSTSPSMEVTKAFLSKKRKGMAAGTLFIITNGWGYDISPYSLYPNESEILLEPERQFKVLSVIPAELTIVKLEMLKSPIVLPSAFGVHKTRASLLYFLKPKGDDRRNVRRNRAGKNSQSTGEKTVIMLDDDEDDDEEYYEGSGASSESDKDEVNTSKILK